MRKTWQKKSRFFFFQEVIEKGLKKAIKNTFFYGWKWLEIGGDFAKYIDSSLDNAFIL